MPLDRLPARPSPNSPAGLKIENTRLKKENTELKVQALTDPLTGLYNRRFLYQQLDRYGKSGDIRGITSLIFDVDNFGDYNKNLIDTYGKERGHFLGDKILQKIANVLTDSVRATDIVTRPGGDEFVAIFPNLIEEEKIQLLVYRINENIEKNLAENGIHVSFGFATTIKDDPTKPQDFSSTLQQADNHLLEMKKYKNIL
jgi:putative two-component system response regulator